MKRGPYWPIGRIKTHRLPLPRRVEYDKHGSPYYVYRGTSEKRIAKAMWLVHRLTMEKQVAQ